MPREYMRSWGLTRRQNETIRVGSLLNPSDYGCTVGELRERRILSELKLYVETSAALPPNPPQFSPVVEDHALLFFKYYEPENRKLVYLQSRLVNLRDKVVDLCPTLCAMVGLPLTTPLLCYEEIKPSMIENLRKSATLKSCELGTGDIICFQRDVQRE